MALICYKKVPNKASQQDHKTAASLWFCGLCWRRYTSINKTQNAGGGNLKMHRLLPLLICNFICLGGCSGLVENTRVKDNWTKDNFTFNQYSKDKATCNYEAEKSLATVPTNSYGQAYQWAMNRKHLTESCLKAKGYIQTH